MKLYTPDEIITCKCGLVWEADDMEREKDGETVQLTCPECGLTIRRKDGD